MCFAHFFREKKLLLTQPSTPHKAQALDRFAGEFLNPTGKIKPDFNTLPICPGWFWQAASAELSHQRKCSTAWVSHCFCTGAFLPKVFSASVSDGEKFYFHKPTCEMGTGMQCPPGVPWCCAGTGNPSGQGLCSLIASLASCLPFWSCFLRGFSTFPSRLLLEQSCFPLGCPSSSSLHRDEGSRKSSEVQLGQELLARRVFALW